MLVVDVGITVQGEDEEELPERIFSQVRLSHIDFNLSADIDFIKD